MEGLFGNPISTGTVVNSGDKDVQEVWRLWCEATKRPRQPTPDKKFAAKYRAARLDRISHSAIMDRVKAAAYLPPRPRDPSDVRRATMAMTRDDLYRQGRRVMTEGGEPIVFGASPTGGDKCSVQDVVEACGVADDMWTLQEHAACDQLVRMCSPDDVLYAADVARGEFNLPEVFPTHLLLTEKLWRGRDGAEVDVKLNSHRSVNARGRAEMGEIPADVLSLDAQARKMYLAGKSAEDVIAFHNLAPEGFWDMALSLVDSGVSIADAVQRAELKFSWSGDSR